MILRRIPLMIFSFTVCAALCAAAQDAPPAAVHEIQMTAKKYEFNPSTITVKKGERVKLVITALDKDHGIKIEAFGINQVLKKGDPTSVEFAPDKAGEFPFVCSKYCGLGHGKMKAKIVVEQ